MFSSRPPMRGRGIAGQDFDGSATGCLSGQNGCRRAPKHHRCAVNDCHRQVRVRLMSGNQLFGSTASFGRTPSGGPTSRVVKRLESFEARLSSLPSTYRTNPAIVLLAHLPCQHSCGLKRCLRLCCLCTSTDVTPVGAQHDGSLRVSHGRDTGAYSTVEAWSVFNQATT